ncbi:MAG: HAMP domain-containing histidine kinase [Myxococcales bacterium]|nr:HAMP domain-containing histidine kinase [Myxococcales bacterium]
MVSLRRRFAFVALLAVLAFALAFVAALQVRADGAAAREHAAFADADALVDYVVATDGDEPTVRRGLAARLAPFVDASAGRCTKGGDFSLVETVAPTALGEPPSAPPPGHGPRGHGPPDVLERFATDRPHMLPLDADVVLRACRSAIAEVQHVRFTAPNDLLFVATRELSGGGVAFALVRMPNRARDRDSHTFLGILVATGALVAALLAIALDTLHALRQGSESLASSFEALRRDLRAEVPTPRAYELARVSEGLSALAKDLAESRNREKQLEHELGHEERLIGLGRVVAGVAHEVRNPLTGMKLVLDGLVRRNLDERSKRDVRTCLQEVERLDSVVKALLLVAKKEPVSRADVDLGALAKARAELLEPFAQSRHVTLDVSGQGRGIVNADDIGRALENLLRNAIEASPPGSRVEIQVAAAPSGATVSVRDWGAGIDEDAEARLFEPFFTQKSEGTGLGLVLSRATARAHGGDLRFERQPDGACFVLSLPEVPA